MSDYPVYSSLFSTIYDEPTPVGDLGRGTHYSVFRCAEWLDVTGHRISDGNAHLHDFAVIWDEDHDTRIINIIEHLYMSSLLAPVQFIGERKGTLTVLVAAKFYYDPTFNTQTYIDLIKKIADESPAHGDCWPAEVGMFDRSRVSGHQFEPKGIIAAEQYRVEMYLKNIDSLWRLGTREYSPRTYQTPDFL